jgi:saccharopine dehydrogenase-like NADP-dependent oxidoreductase
MKDKKILVIGAGLSTPVLIDYLTEHAISNKWQITVADMDKALAEKRIEGKDRASAVFFDVNDEQMIAGLIPGFDLVISMLPAFLHTKVIEACLEYRIHMITASYNPVNAADYHHIAKERGIIMLNEMGLDPGIDHMSAMELLNKIREKNGQITSFKSSTGGLVAPESDNNPWNYKFSWNPANVVKAGQFGAQFIEDGFYKYIPYHQLFRRTEKIWIEGYGEFETYPNRDSVKYREDYGLKDIPTMYRGTIRRKGYAEAWDALVQLGMTNDVFEMENLADLSYKEFTQSFLPSFSGDLQASLAAYLSLDKQSDTFKKLEWLGLFSDQKTGLTKGTPATVLQ